MKKVSCLVTVALGICFGALNINPAYSSEITEEKDNVLMSQLRGHDTYEGEQQMNWEQYSLGRVVGKSGNIMSIKAEDGTVFYAEGSVRTGSDVLIDKDENGDYFVVSAAESEWISYLEEDYGYKRNKVIAKSLNERTAAIWRDIESDSNMTITQRLDSETRTTQTTNDSFTVRGLW